MPLKVVSERLGHSSPVFTMDTNQHILPGMEADAANTFAALLSDDLSNGFYPEETVKPRRTRKRTRVQQICNKEGPAACLPWSATCDRAVQEVASGER